MATNPYFNNFNAANEQNLVEDLTIEAIQIKGMDVMYVPRTHLNLDRFFGEDPTSAFESATVIEMYLESIAGFEGQGDLLSKFGLQVKDRAFLIVAKRRFEDELGMVRPKEGDLIYYPLTKGLFEITFVEHENPFYQLGKLYSFKLTVELFQFSEETIETGELVVDSIADKYRFKQYFTLTGGTGTMFSIGDRIYQYANGSATGSTASADASAIVNSITGNQIYVTNIIGKWYASDDVTRYATSGNNSTYRIVSGIDDTINNSAYDNNKIIQTKSDTDLDFTITNPFGTP